MESIQKLLEQMTTPDNLNVREFLIAGTRAVIVNHPDITDSEVVFRAVEALQRFSPRLELGSESPFSGKEIKLELKTISDSVLYSAEVKEKEDGVLEDILTGDAVVAVEGLSGFLVISAKKWDKRGIMEPPNEMVQRGPREGFIEDMKTNLGHLFRRLKTPEFAVEKMKIGRKGNVNAALCYISSIAAPKLVNKIRKKLQEIDVDTVLDAHYLLPLIEPHPDSLFAQAGITEKPDVVASKLLEGRIAIVLDGSPTVLTLPFLLIEDLQSPEDYYSRGKYASFARSLRFVALILAVILPGVYVALQMFHYNILPVNFLIMVQNFTKGGPLRPLPEVLLILLVFEVIRESSLRMPRAVIMVIGLVAGISLGEAAMISGLFSPPAILIVALSSISLFTVPNQVGVTSLLRIGFTILGGLFGIYGLFIGAFFLVTALVNFDSFGTPYLAPLSPLVYSDLKDSFYFAGTEKTKTRPYSLPGRNKVRQK